MTLTLLDIMTDIYSFISIDRKDDRQIVLRIVLVDKQILLVGKQVLQMEK